MRNFREALWLPGWSDRSIWGYDEQMDTYFAQLWRDEDRNYEPTIWISGFDPIESGPQLATRIALATGSKVDLVTRAMAMTQSAPRALRDSPMALLRWLRRK